MQYLVGIVEDIDSTLKQSDDVVIELVDLSKEDADYLTGELNKYNVRKAKVISGDDRSFTYTLHVCNR